MVAVKKLVTPLIIATISFAFSYFLTAHSRLIEGIPLIWILVSWSLLLQVIAFIPAVIFNTERYYDLTGSLTFLTCSLSATFSNPDPSIRQIIAVTFVVVWACRLGSFLFLRILKAGHDSRFVKIKQSRLRFFYSWLLQGLWVYLTMGPLLALMVMDGTKTEGNWHFLEVFGLLLWAAGFAVEIIADRQKTDFKKVAANAGKFIKEGLWKYSRHPNYVGEISLWTGAALFAAPSLSGGQLFSLISPLFVYLLIGRVSGVPLLEEQAE
jgi:steroid 5-alpha reductase family enzyme